MSQAVTKPVPRHALPRTGGPGIALPAAAASLASLLLVAAAAAASLLLLQPPAPVSRLAPADQFSAERAMDHVRAIAVEPHPAGSPAQAAARDYIVAQLAKLGMPVSVRGETSVNDFGQTPYGATYRAAATVENVVGRLPGRTSAHPLILLASYDSVPAGPGANNSAAAVAALIETARALRTGPRLRNDVVFLFTDGEEYGLLGAKAFAERNPWVRQAGAAINFTSRGSSGPVVMFQTGPDSGELVGQLAAVVPRTFASSLYDEAYRFFPNATDLSVFIDRGVPGLNFAYFGGFDRNHSPLDTAASVDVRSVQQLGDYALPLTRRLADLDLGAPRSANPTYFDVLGRFTVVYPAGWQLPLTALAVGLWTAAAAAGLGRRRLSVRGLLAGMGLFVAAVVAAAGVAAALAGPLGGRHAEFAYYGDTANGTTYLAGFVSLAVGAIVAAAALARRRLGGLGLAFGASVPWAALAAATAFVAPGTNYLFAWPLLFAAVALGAGALGRPAGTWRRLLQAVCCVPAVVLAAPLVVLLAQTLGLQLVAVAVVLAALAMGLLLPLLPRTRRQWAASAGAAALGVALLGAATVPAAPTAAHPRPDDVLYALDADTGRATWASTNADTDAWTGQFLHPDARRAPLGSVFPGWTRPFLQEPAAPLPDLPAPQARVESDTVRDGFRSVRLRITSSRGASSALVVVDAHVLGYTVDGVSGRAGGDGGRFELWLWTIPAGGAELSLTVPAGSELPLRVTDRTPGLPGALAFTPRPRTADLVPAPSIDVAYFSNATYVARSFDLGRGETAP